MSSARVLFALIASLFMSVAACAAESGAQKLVGLWGSENFYGPLVTGPVTVDGRGSEWHARIAGFDVAVSHDGDEVTFALPSEQGKFRGRLEDSGRAIEGQWIQAPGITNNNAYASPVKLSLSQDKVWQGTVTPVQDRLTFYVEIKTTPDGTYTASIRNPEFNLGRRGPYKLTLDGKHVQLSSSRGGNVSGSYDPDKDLLSLDYEAHYDFTRRDRNTAVGFYPVTPARGYSYQQPLQDDDGWATGNLQEVGLDAKPVQALVLKIRDTNYDGPHTPYIHSLLIARHGKLVLEEYFYGYGPEDTHSTRSAGKTLAGALIGIALDRGAKFTVDTPVISLFPTYKDVANLDTRKRAITVRDLLTMTSGLNCDDDNDDSPGNEDTMQSQSQQPDWYKYTLDLPMSKNPGGDQAVYCSAGVNLLGGVVKNATGTPLPEFFTQYYAAPLDIHLYHMNLMPTGNGYVGGGIEMRPRDQLKLGQLYLDGGMWRGKRVVSERWVKASWQVDSAFASDHHYGYTWHIVDIKAGDKIYRTYEAGGNGGQFTIAIPELDMVVGFTAGNYGDFSTWYKFMTELVPQYIVAAATHQ